MKNVIASSRMRSPELFPQNPQPLEPPSSPASLVLWQGVAWVYKVHRVWRWYRRGLLYTNPDHFAQLLAGHATNFAFGDHWLVKTVARIVLIAQRTMKCFETVSQIGKVWSQEKDAVRCTYVVHIPGPWPKEASSWISPSTSYAWREKIRGIALRVQLIFITTMHLLWLLFQLLMQILDAIDAFSFSQESTDEGINELFVNGTDCLKMIVEHKSDLLESLRDHRETIHAILYSLGSFITADQLISAFSEGLDKTESFYNGLKDVNDKTNNILWDAFQRGAFTVMSTLNLSQHTPDFLVPHPKMPWERGKHKRRRQELKTAKG